MRTLKERSFLLDISAKEKILRWAQQFEDVVWLDSNEYRQKHSSYSAILAVDSFTSLKTSGAGSFDELESYQAAIGDWIFGYLTYDLKNDLEELSSGNHDGLGFPDLYFFQPKRLFLFKENMVEIRYLNMVSDELETDWANILRTKPENVPQAKSEPVKISLRTSKDTYKERLLKMKAHIARGDIYEANFCQEFFAENTAIDPLPTYFNLNGISLPPFATFLKVGDLFALSASPERYLKRSGSSVISQPIKGTAKRAAKPQDDIHLIEKLVRDPKERSENIMITDLVRNDLSRFALKGSVHVDELCGVYTFEQVHHLISTVRCEVPADVSSVSLIRGTFPMGSMTGAPKIASMKIIEELEDTKRGLYSGTVGYFDPMGDFDLNVVIRSILYNSRSAYLSYSVGSAITSGSDPEKEYQECLLKAKAMREVLEA